MTLPVIALVSFTLLAAPTAPGAGRLVVDGFDHSPLLTPGGAP